MNISLATAQKFLRLANSETLPFSSFQGRISELIDTMIKDGILKINGKRKLYCINRTNLESYLKNKQLIGSENIEAYIEYLQNSTNERSDSVKNAFDSKHEGQRIYKGFLINCYDDIWGELKNKKILLRSNSGSFLFIEDFLNFHVDKTITIVVVENYENFKYIERQKYLFPNLTPLFIWRYQNSNSIAEWLSIIPNNYLHFGDFDLAGIRIYLTEFRNKINDINRCKFFIAENIGDLILKNGNTKRFFKQYEKLKNFDFTKYPEISDLAQLILQEKKGLDQEFLILSKK